VCTFFTAASAAALFFTAVFWNGHQDTVFMDHTCAYAMDNETDAIYDDSDYDDEYYDDEDYEDDYPDEDNETA
jgi:hypothetical protein